MWSGYLFDQGVLGFGRRENVLDHPSAAERGGVQHFERDGVGDLTCSHADLIPG